MEASATAKASPKAASKAASQKPESNEDDIALLRRHGAATAASPAARNRVAAPGPGTHTIGKHDEILTRPVNVRTVFGRSQRFRREPPFLPGLAPEHPGPGSYEHASKICLGQYHEGGRRSHKTAPKWTIARRPPMEFAKTYN
mmetsp:Transcript_22062/g.42371  ORF Transcript_22062/g.42371 Transcript_22062/m.42371 type:complete len:143 (+) Transcript_22062:87-515(+)